MEKALGFYPRDAGSIPAGGTILHMRNYFTEFLLVLQRYHISNINRTSTEQHKESIYNVVFHEVDYELHRKRHEK